MARWFITLRFLQIIDPNKILYNRFDHYNIIQPWKLNYLRRYSEYLDTCSKILYIMYIYTVKHEKFAACQFR